jgi:hypothetical protein
MICDGRELAWNGGANYNYNGFRREFDRLKEIPPEVEIVLSGTYDPATGEGSVTATVKNITSENISGKVHFAICQKDTPFVWYDATMLRHIERKMLPDSNGTSISLDADESTNVTESFTVETSWQRDNCYLVAFVQDSDTDILQAIEIDLLDMGTTPVIHRVKEVKEEIRFKKTADAFMMYVPFTASYTVTITDVRGKKLNSFTAPANTQWLDMSELLSSGVHIISASASGKTLVKKLWYVK